MEYINRLLHRSATKSPSSPPPSPTSGNDSQLPKTAEHEVKVCFAREFADVGSAAVSTPESLSSASSFHSLRSTLSTKSSSGICPDSVPHTPEDVSNVSYLNNDIPGINDLILACADIQLTNEQDQTYATLYNSQDLSQDQTFTSATDEPILDTTKDFLDEQSDTESHDLTQVIQDNQSTHDSINLILDHTQDICDYPTLNTNGFKDSSPVVSNASVEDSIPQKLTESIEESVLNENNKLEYCTSEFSNTSIKDAVNCSTQNTDLNTLVSTSPKKPDIEATEENNTLEKDKDVEISLISNSTQYPVINCTPTISILTEHVESPSLPSLSSTSLLEDVGLKTSDIILNNVTKEELRPSAPNDNIPEKVTSPKVLNNSVNLSKQVIESKINGIGNAHEIFDEQFTIQNTTGNKAEENEIIEVEKAQENRHKINEDDSTTILLNNTNILIPASPKFENSLEGICVHGLEIKNTTILTGREVSPQKIDFSPNHLKSSPVIAGKQIPEIQEDIKLPDFLVTETFKPIEEIDLTDALEQEDRSAENLEDTLTLQDVCMNLVSLPDIEQYETFKPKRQSTTAVAISEQENFDELKLAAEKVANDIFKSSLELTEGDTFASATSDIFQDPKSFDFLLRRSNTTNSDRLRAESLYVKFDPLVSNTSMLPQGNSQPINEEQNGKNETSHPAPVTPKRNPAIAAIDRLLFYTPISSNTGQKAEETPEKNEQPIEELKPDSAVIADINMSKELELVRATVLQLEEELEKHKNQYEVELEKRKKEYEVELEKQKKEYEVELEKHRNAFQEKISKMQAQLTQEMKSKTQMTVVVEEYEKSISRLLTEGERDRTNLEQEKTKLQEELQAANHHLTNTEAAFNDVHSKYERLKGVVSAYKSNETVLKESIQENIETIKALENRYDQLKSHAMAQLEKANLELDAIRKQHEAETVKLHAMVRKADLKSNSLAELVEQKTKENKELTQILDEVIARVGHQNAE